MSVRKEQLAENVVVYCGDNRAILPTLGRFDVCVTDPPYGIGFPYNSYDDSEDNLRSLITETLPLVLRNAGRTIITPGVTNIALYPRPDWTGCWTWETTATYGKLGYSQWQPILFYGEDLPGFGSVNGILKADRIHFTGGSAKIKTEDGGGHTCPKPIAFIERLICRFSNSGEIVCDPFLGSGTTGLAAVRNGRCFIGIELDERYFDVACRRIADELRRPRLFAEPVTKPVQEALFG